MSNKGMRYNVAHVSEDRSYLNEYMKKWVYDKYLEQKRKNGGEDLYITKDIKNKRDFPIYERCEGFDELWNNIYKQVVYNWTVVRNINEIE